MRNNTRSSRWRTQNLLTMRELAGTAATLIRAEAAADRARATLGSDTVLVVAEVFGPAGAVYRFDHRAPVGMKWARQSRG
jgi:hypothetical protein